MLQPFVNFEAMKCNNCGVAGHLEKACFQKKLRKPGSAFDNPWVRGIRAVQEVWTKLDAPRLFEVQNICQSLIGDTIQVRGPDGLLPAEDHLSWSLDRPVKLRLKAGDDHTTPVSVVTAFEEVSSKYPDSIAFVDFYGNKEERYSYHMYYKSVVQLSKVFIKLGLESQRGVGIIGHHSPHWLISHMAAIHAGGVAVGLYSLNTTATYEYIGKESQCNVVVVENDEELQRFLQIADRLPSLKAIIQCRGEPKRADIYSWDYVMNLNVDDLQGGLEGRIEEIAPNKCCALVYTSGTTGRPKGIMLSHDNLVWKGRKLNSIINGKNRHQNLVVLSYHQGGHISSLVSDVYFPLMSCGGTTCFVYCTVAQVDEFFETMSKVRPTFFYGSPEVWRTIMDRLIAGSLEAHDDLWERTGLRGCFAATGSSPCLQEIIDYFRGFGVRLMDRFGMTETTGPHVANTRDVDKKGTVGKPHHGMPVKLSNVSRDGIGEIFLDGRGIFMGYLNQEASTRSSFDGDGWFDSGDLGKFDGEGFLTLTGRKQEIIKLVRGTKIYPESVERRIMGRLPCLGHCVAVGDTRKYLTLLLTFKTEANPSNGMPTDFLHKTALDWCRSAGSDAKTVSEIISSESPAIVNAIQRMVDAMNEEEAISEHYLVKKWIVLPRGFSIQGGEIGPTHKVRRAAVCDKYKKEIDEMYYEP